MVRIQHQGVSHS